MPPTGASATGRKRPAPADAPAPPAKVAATKSVGSKAHPARATRSAAPPRAAPKRRAPRRAALRGPVERAAEPGKVADKGATAGRAMGGVPGRGRRARRAPATRKDAGGGRGARPAAAALPPPMTAVHLNTFIATDIASIAPPTHPTPLPSATTPLAASPRAVPDPTPAPLAKTNADSADSAADAVPTSPLAPAPTARAPLDSGWFDPADPAKVALVRRALQGDFLAPPPGHAPVARATEARALDAAVAACLASGRGGVVWVSGRSGTGKSLTANAVLAAPNAAWRGAPRGAPAGAPPPAAVWLNCFLLETPSSAPSRLADALEAAAAWDGRLPRLVVPATARPAAGRRDGEPADAALDRARRAAAALSAAPSGGGVVIVLDEADAVATGATPPLRALLSLAAAPDARVALIAIANAADADRRLARLDGGREPVASIHFEPYAPSALASLLGARVASLPGAAFHPRALRLVAARVAARGGDARAAVKAAGRALELACADAGAGVGAAGGAPKAPPAPAPTPLSPRNPAAQPLSPAAAAARPAPPPATTAPPPLVRLVGLHHADAACAAATDAWGERAVADLPPACQFALVALLRAARAAARGGGGGGGALAALAGRPAFCAPAAPRAKVGGSSFSVSCPVTAAAPKKKPAAAAAPPAGAALDAVLAAHAKLCARLGVRAAPSADVAASLAALEGAGLAELSRGAERPRVGGRSRAEAGRRAAPRVGVDAVRGALAGTRLLAACLEDW